MNVNFFYLLKSPGENTDCTYTYQCVFSLEQVHWCQREHQEQPPLDATVGRSSSRLLQNQSSQLVIELSEQVATLSNELEQARQMIQQRQEEETPWNTVCHATLQCHVTGWRQLLPLLLYHVSGIKARKELLNECVCLFLRTDETVVLYAILHTLHWTMVYWGTSIQYYICTVM